MDAEILEALQKLPLFNGLPQAVLIRIAEHSETRELVKGDVLVRVGDPSDSLFIIRQGWVKVVGRGNKGEEIILNQCGPGQIIGEMSLIDQLPRSTTMIAISAVKLMEIKYNVVREVIEDSPALTMALLRDMTNRLRFANTYIEEAVEWCQQIAAGNYEFVEDQVDRSRSTIVDLTQSHEARASAFLSSFFKMIRQVRQREEGLKQQLQELTIQIDETKRQQTVTEITESTFFEGLQAAAQRLREKRNAEQQNEPQAGGDS
jgi:CRP-like cAMP-binding protein